MEFKKSDLIRKLKEEGNLSSDAWDFIDACTDDWLVDDLSIGNDSTYEVRYFDYLSWGGEVYPVSQTFSGNFDSIRAMIEYLAFLRFRQLEEINGGTKTTHELFAPDVFNTGGNTWLASMWIDANHYYIVEAEDLFCDECPEEKYLTLYDCRGEDNDHCACQNQVWCKGLDELTPGERKYYDELLDALREELL